MNPPAIRKPVDALTLGDLEVWPLWEFADDEEGVEGQDETWVRPSPDSRLLARISPYLVRAQFTTPDGEEVLGGVWVITRDGLRVDGISLFPSGTYIPVEAKGHPLEGDTRTKLAATGILFPLTFQLSVGTAKHATPTAGVFE